MKILSKITSKMKEIDEIIQEKVKDESIRTRPPNIANLKAFSYDDLKSKFMTGAKNYLATI